MRTLRLGLLVFTLQAFGGALHAQVIWNFGTSTGSAAVSSGVPANLTASAVTQNNNSGTTTLLSSSSPSTGYAGASGQFNASASAVAGAFNPAASSYFEFSLTPFSNYQVSLTGLSFSTRSTSTGPTSIAVYSSVNGYSSSLAAGSSPNGSWALVSSGTLSSVTGTSLAPLTVRIYGFGGTGTVGTPNWKIDDITATVSVTAIPEPATWAAILGALVFTGVVLRRRQRSQAA